MQDSVLTFESFESSDQKGKGRNANLDGTSQQCLAFDPGDSNRASEGHSVMDG